MKVKLRLFLLFAALSLSQAPLFALAAADAPASTSPTAAVAPPSLELFLPLASQSSTSKDVDLHGFEFLRPVPSGEPKLLVEFDSAAPIPIDEADYTLAELPSGLHVARMTLVDANDQPVQGGSATVRFKVPQSARAGGLNATHLPVPCLRGAAPALPIPPVLRNDGDPDLPLKGSPLPLISIVGFGLLIGGIVPAMRARKISAVHS
jgi:hypothetical protein